MTNSSYPAGIQATATDPRNPLYDGLDGCKQCDGGNVPDCMACGGSGYEQAPGCTEVTVFVGSVFDCE